MAVDYSSIVIGSRAAGLGLRDEDERRRESFQRSPSPNMYGPSSEDKDLLSKAAKASSPVLETVGAFGNILDVPGSFVRDVVSLLPGGPAPNNPFDQLLPWNWASSEGRTTEEDILEGYGFYDDGPSEGRSTATNVGRFAGELAVGVALDPLTYLTGGLAAAGRATKGGKALKSIGFMKDGLIDSANERLIKAASEKAGRKVGKREAALIATPRDVLNTVLDADTIGKAPKVKASNQARFDAALSQDLRKAKEAKKKAASKSVDEVITDGYFRLGAFGKGKTFFKGDKALKLARAMDTAGEAVKFGKFSPVRQLSPVFNKSLRGVARTAQAQKAALREADRLMESEAAARESIFQSQLNIERSSLMQNADPQTRAVYNDAMIEYMEDIGRERESFELLDDAGNKVLDKEGNQVIRYRVKDGSYDSWKNNLVSNNQLFADLDSAGILDELDLMKDEIRNTLEYAQKSGVGLEELDDKYASYLTRLARVDDVANPGRRARDRKAYDPTTEFATGRQKHRKNIKGGTAMLQRMSRDLDYAGQKEVYTQAEWKKGKRTTLLNDFLNDEKYKDAMSDLTDSQKEKLFDDIAARPRNQVKAGMGFYQDNVATAALTGISSVNAAAAKSTGLKSFLAEQATIRTPDDLDAVTRLAIDTFGNDDLGNTSYYTVEQAMRSLFGPMLDPAARRIAITRLAGDGSDGALKKSLNPRVTPDGSDVRRGSDPDGPSGGSPSDPGTDPSGGGPGGGTPPSSPPSSGGGLVDVVGTPADAQRTAQELTKGMSGAGQTARGKKTGAGKAREAESPSPEVGPSFEDFKIGSEMYGERAFEVEPQEAAGKLDLLRRLASGNSADKELARKIVENNPQAYDSKQVRDAVSDLSDDDPLSALLKGAGRESSSQAEDFNRTRGSAAEAMDDMEAARETAETLLRGSGDSADDVAGSTVTKGQVAEGLDDSADAVSRAEATASQLTEGLDAVEGSSRTVIPEGGILSLLGEGKGVVSKAIKDDNQLLEGLLRKDLRSIAAVLDSEIKGNSKAGLTKQIINVVNGRPAKQRKAASKRRTRGRKSKQADELVKQADELEKVRANNGKQWQRAEQVRSPGSEFVVIADMANRRAIKGSGGAYAKGHTAINSMPPIEYIEQRLTPLIQEELDQLSKAYGKDIDPEIPISKQITFEDRVKRLKEVAKEWEERKNSGLLPPIEDLDANAAKTREFIEENLKKAKNGTIKGRGKTKKVAGLLKAMGDPYAPRSLSSQWLLQQIIEDYDLPEIITDVIKAFADGEIKDLLTLIAIKQNKENILESKAGTQFARPRREIERLWSQGDWDNIPNKIPDEMYNELWEESLSRVRNDVDPELLPKNPRLEKKVANKEIVEEVSEESSDVRPESLSETIDSGIDPESMRSYFVYGGSVYRKPAAMAQNLWDNVTSKLHGDISEEEKGKTLGALFQFKETDKALAEQARSYHAAERGSSGTILNQLEDGSFVAHRGRDAMRLLSKKTGTAKGSLIAKAVDKNAEGYSSYLESASEDLTALIDELKPAYQSLESFIMSNTPQLQRLQTSLSSSGGLDEVVRAAREYDQALIDANTPVFIGNFGKSQEALLRNFGVNIPTGVRIASEEGHAVLMGEAERLFRQGNLASSRFVNSIANPLMDVEGNLFGSIFATNYMNPVAIADLAEKSMGGSFLKEHGYSDLAKLIEDKPEVFEAMVNGLRSKVDNMQSDAIRFGRPESKQKIFYQTVEDVFEDEEGFFELPFKTKTQNIVDGMRDTVVVRREMFNSLTADEVEDLGLDDFFGQFREMFPQENAPRVSHLKVWLETMTPQIMGVNLKSTGRVHYGAHTVPGGDPSTYTEILLKMPRGENGFRDHFLNISKPDKFGSSISEMSPYVDEVKFGRDIAENIVLHLRGNVVTQDGKKIFRVMEDQSLMSQKSNEISALEKKIEKSGIAVSEMSLAEVRNALKELQATRKSLLGDGLTWNDDQVLEYTDIISTLRNYINSVDDYNYSGRIPFRRDYMQVGLKTALLVAARNGMDAIALVDGDDIAKAVGGSEEGLRRSYRKSREKFDTYMKKSPGGNASYSAIAKSNRVDPKRMKLDSLGEGVYYAGTDDMGIPIMIVEDTGSGGYAVFRDGFLPVRDFRREESVPFIRGQEGYGIDRENLEGVGLDLFQAKKLAAEIINQPKLSEYGTDNSYSRKMSVWDLNDDIRSFAEQQTLYQQENSIKRAAIKFPKGPSDEWINSQYKTLIVAYDTADPYSYAHEMGHLFRNFLKHAEPGILDDAERIFGVVNGNWHKAKEELFADSFMQWVANGGKTPDRGLQGVWEKMKSFMLETYNSYVKGYDAEKNLSKEMNQFFDDVFGADRYADRSPKSITDILDTFKYASPALLANVAEALGPETLDAAKNAAIEGNVRGIREKFVRDLSKSGGISFDEADRRVPVFESLLEDTLSQVDTIRKSGADMPKSINVPVRGTNKTIKVKMPDVRDAMRQMRVPTEVAQDIERVWNLTSQIEAGDLPFSEYADAVTNLFKASVTAPFPAFHIRNLTSGMIQNALNDVFDPDAPLLSRYVKPHMDAAKVLVGDNLEDLGGVELFKGMSPQQATDELRKLAYIYGVYDSPGQLRDIYGVGGSPADALPGAIRQEGDSLARRLKSFVKKKAADPYEEAGQKVGILDKINFTKTAGAFSGTDRFIGARYGRAIGDLVEGTHRLGGFLAMLKQGYDPAEAAKRIKLLHVDYSDLTKTERQILRRLFPFYSFNKGMVKYLADEIYRRPGGKVGQTIRAARLTREQEASTPEYISSGVALPLGVSEDGSRRFLTGLGLMHEGVLPLFDSGVKAASGGGLGKFAFELGTNLNPVPKSIFEMSSGTSMFQEGPAGGRRLEDMDPLLGRTLSNTGNFIGLTDRDQPYRLGQGVESLVSNSPASRALSTVKQLTDSRKGLISRGLNSLTGLKVSDVSQASQDAVLRERASQLMRGLGGRTFERSYIPDYAKEGLSPEELERAEMYEALMNLLAKRAKERKAIREMQEAQNN